MALASLALRTTNVTISNAAVELQTAAGAQARLLECSIIQATGTASSFGLGRPAAIGVTPGTQSLFQRDDPNLPACVTKAGLTWGTSPTSPTIFHRRWNSAATIGVGIIWTFPRALVVAISSAVVVFNITATVAIDVNFAIDE